MRHWIAFDPRTSRLELEDAPYEYQACVPTRTHVVAATRSPSWCARYSRIRSGSSARSASHMVWKYESGRPVKPSREAVSRYSAWNAARSSRPPCDTSAPVSYTHLRAHETG